MSDSQINEEQIKQEYEQFQREFPGMSTMFVLDAQGNILMSTDPDFIGAEEAKNLLDVWKNHKSPLVIGEKRYPVLKWDDIQFAAKNVKDKTAIIGSICKSGRYCVVHYTGKGNLLQSTIDLNRWCWNKI